MTTRHFKLFALTDEVAGHFYLFRDMSLRMNRDYEYQPTVLTCVISQDQARQLRRDLKKQMRKGSAAHKAAFDVLGDTLYLLSYNEFGEGPHVKGLMIKRIAETV